MPIDDFFKNDSAKTNSSSIISLTIETYINNLFNISKSTLKSNVHPDTIKAIIVPYSQYGLKEAGLGCASSYYQLYNRTKPIKKVILLCTNTTDTNNLNLEKIPNDAGYLISLQPGLWCYQTFVSLYSFNAHRPNLLEIITNEDCSFKNKLTDKFFYENVRLSEDSILFPHIHSITYGKWVISNDSYNKFELLFKEYNINTDIRGVI